MVAGIPVISESIEKYASSKTRERADLFIRKYLPNGQEKKKPSLIEAKRARRWRRDPGDGTVTIDPRTKLKKDISKLDKERKYRKKERSEDILCHLLLWGANGDTAHSEAPISDLPQDFITEYSSRLRPHGVSWLPLAWADNSTPVDTPPPRITRWLWIALFELTEEE